jgi:hypothetical protein
MKIPPIIHGAISSFRHLINKQTNIGVTYETFHLSVKTLVAIDVLKRSDSGFAKEDAQFFKMIGAMLSGPEQIRSNVFQQLGRDKICSGRLVVFQVFQRPCYFPEVDWDQKASAAFHTKNSLKFQKSLFL